MGKSSNIVDISQADKTDVEYVGKKAFKFGELKCLGIPIPEGFVIKTSFFEEFLKTTGIFKDIEKAKKMYHPSMEDSAEKLFQPVREKIMHTHLPQTLARELREFYRKLAGEFKETAVNIFSSSNTNKSIFFSNIKGDANLVLKIKAIWSFYLDNPVAVAIIKNIKSEIKGKIPTNNSAADKKLTKLQIDKLIKYCRIVQKYLYFPQELDYAVVKDKIYIIDVKPLTEIPEPAISALQINKLQKALAKGIPINPGIVTGPVKILRNKGIDQIRSDEIIVISNLNPSLYNKIRKAKAVVTDSILPKPYDRIVYRTNIKAPTVGGAANAVKILQERNIITVNGITGEIYSGGLTS